MDVRPFQAQTHLKVFLITDEHVHFVDDASKNLGSRSFGAVRGP